MKITVWVLNSCVPNDNGPVIPQVFGSLEEARAGFDRVMRDEWDVAEPYDDEGENPPPYPDSPEEAVEFLDKYYCDGSWGRWELTEHTVEVLT